jgi:hypothetical protein
MWMHIDFLGSGTVCECTYGSASYYKIEYALIPFTKHGPDSSS